MDKLQDSSSRKQGKNSRIQFCIVRPESSILKCLYFAYIISNEFICIEEDRFTACIGIYFGNVKELCYTYGTDGR